MMEFIIAMSGWPLATVVCVTIFCLYGIVDTWLKRPYFEKRVGNLVVRMRGEEARAAMNHFNSMTVMGFQDALDDAAADPSKPELKRGRKFERSTSAKR